MARQLVQTLKEKSEADPAAASRREHAAREQAAVRRQKGIEAALAQLPELEQIKRRNGGKAEDARASTTDAQANVMKMADGGYRPAYNVLDFSDTSAVNGSLASPGAQFGQLLAAAFDEVIDTQ